MELLSLDSSPLFVPKTITDFLAQLAAIKDGSQRSSELDGYVKRLEDELRKIEVFKRELPLCMLLLKDAIELLKEEGMRWRRMEERPVVEVFIPLKGNSEEDGGLVSGKENIDKKNWMSSAQLWNTSINVFDYTKRDSVELKLGNEEDDRSVTENPIEVSNNRAVEGALLAFRGQNELSGFAKPCLKEVKEVSEVPNLCLMTPLMSEALGCSASANSRTSNGCKGSGSGSGVAGQVKLLNKPQPQQQQQPLRKPRRCWSPELHRRFVDALQQLGGTEATPKQIRELMQVEGLTNDEVKSHLQKYRLHIRKLPPSAAAGQGNALLMSLDHSGDHSKANNVQSGSPQGPLLAGGFAKCRSTTRGESGNSREAEEDEKSDG
ncbi:hypothetical protein FF1_027291 [Malus domestica]|uniref:transcription factor HHO5-like isoform X2 n=1 Tax=Malus domestica TaxID=3750 RepID=UPI0010A9EE22|nr:transcription factor HHO5-like isoform X2 [Malus domestica]XP_050137506.1 transcription factor HHO5-like isoform X2 [Malus sylvestris]